MNGKTISNNSKVTCFLNRYNARCSTYVQQLIVNKKGCRWFYDILTTANTAANTFILDHNIAPCLVSNYVLEEYFKT